MLTDDVIQVLQKYQETNPAIISEINNDINNITLKLKNIKDYLAKEITLLANDDSPDNNIEEIVHDSKILKKYISTIKLIPVNKHILTEEQLPIVDIIDKILVYVIDDSICPKCGVHIKDYKIDYIQKSMSKSVMWHKCPTCNQLFVINYETGYFDNSNTNIILDYTYHEQRTVTFNDVIVLSNVRSCTIKEHGLADVIARLPIFLNEGDIGFTDISISYCPKCNKYIMLKKDFKQIEGVIACKVIDQTTSQNNNYNYDEIEIEQKKSILYQYGYNVKTKAGLSDKQRHMILAAVVESQILTRGQICSHLDTLIERGSKIEKWKLATQKWKQDRQFVKKYNIKNLPPVLFNKVILKYNVSK